MRSREARKTRTGHTPPCPPGSSALVVKQVSEGVLNIPVPICNVPSVKMSWADFQGILERLLLDSRVVDVPMSSNPLAVTLSSLKPFFFQWPSIRRCASQTMVEHKTPESKKSVC